MESFTLENKNDIITMCVFLLMSFVPGKLYRVQDTQGVCKNTLL